jgi:hypothetical protein
MNTITRVKLILCTSRREADSLAEHLRASGKEPTVTPRSSGVFAVEWVHSAGKLAAD